MSVTSTTVVVESESFLFVSVCIVFILVIPLSKLQLLTPSETSLLQPHAHCITSVPLTVLFDFCQVCTAIVRVFVDVTVEIKSATSIS